MVILANPPYNHLRGADLRLSTGDSEDNLEVTVLINPAAMSSKAIFGSPSAVLGIGKTTSMEH